MTEGRRPLPVWLASQVGSRWLIGVNGMKESWPISSQRLGLYRRGLRASLALCGELAMSRQLRRMVRGSSVSAGARTVAGARPGMPPVLATSAVREGSRRPQKTAERCVDVRKAGLGACFVAKDFCHGSLLHSVSKWLKIKGRRLRLGLFENRQFHWVLFLWKTFANRPANPLIWRGLRAGGVNPET